MARSFDVAQSFLDQLAWVYPELEFIVIGERESVSPQENVPFGLSKKPHWVKVLRVKPSQDALVLELELYRLKNLIEHGVLRWMRRLHNKVLQLCNFVRLGGGGMPVL